MLAYYEDRYVGNKFKKTVELYEVIVNPAEAGKFTLITWLNKVKFKTLVTPHQVAASPYQKLTYSEDWSICYKYNNTVELYEAINCKPSRCCCILPLA